MDDLRELTGFVLPSHSVRLITVQDRYFISWIRFDTGEARVLEVLGPEHGFVMMDWCIDSLRMATA